MSVLFFIPFSALTIIYQSSKYTDATATSDAVVVEFQKGAAVEVKQTTRDDIVLTFNKAVDLTNADVTIKEVVNVIGGTDKIEYLIKSVTPSEDKKTYTVAVFFEFNDSSVYEVTVKGIEETVSFVASKGAPKTIVLHSNQYDTSDRSVTVDKSTQIWATLYDVNGVDVTTNALRDKLTYTIKYVDSAYENVDTFLYFAEVGEHAVVTAEYHTWEYDENGNEKDAFTSTAFTFYAVAKGEELITNIVDYTTNSNYNSANKHLVKMGTTGATLAVKIKTKDFPDKEVEIKAFGEEVKNHDGSVTFGTAFFTALTPDILEVYDNGATVGLNPRKIGTGRIMLSYKTNVNGVEVNNPIGIVNIDVKAAPVLDTVTISTNNVVFCVDPANNTNSAAVENLEYYLEFKDQYGDAYSNFSLLNENGYVDGFKGLNNLTKRALEQKDASNNPIVVIEYAENCTKDGNATKGIRIFNRKYEAILNDMDGNGVEDVLEDKQETQATRFSFSFAVKDEESKAIKTVNFTADARRAEDNINVKNVVFDLNIGTTQWNGNNVARYVLNDNEDKSECQKEAVFIVYQMSNGAKYDEVDLLGKLPTKEELAAGVSNGYYYVINKNGSDVTSKSDSSDIGKAWLDTPGYPQQINFAFSSTEKSKIDTDRDIVAYTYQEGAGTYEFILYRVTDNKASRVTSRSVNVTCNPGQYTLVSRDEVTAASTNQEDLIKCFTLKDTEGNTLSHKAADVTATTIKFGNNVRDYSVNLNYERTTYTSAGQIDTVFVESITVWDNVDTWGKNADVEYTVPVGFFVKIQ